MGDGRVSTGDLPAVVHSKVEKALGIEHSAITGYVERLRRARPDATPADIIATLEKRYLAVLTGTGAVLGGAAALPGAGTGLGLALSTGKTTLLLETTALFTLAVAEVHAVRLEDGEHRRMLMLAVMLGDGDAELMDTVAGRTGGRWGRLVADLVPMSSISVLNKALCHWFLAQYPRNHKVRVFGKLLSFGIGAGLGAVGNHAFGRIVISTSRRVFGPPPAGFADHAGPTFVPSRRETTSAAARPQLTDRDTGLALLARLAEAAQPATAESRAVPEQRDAPERWAASAPPEAPVTGKYRALFDYLVSQRTDRVELAFPDIDALVPGGLPKSASTVRSWWGNTASSRQAKAWLTAGFEVAGVDLTSRTVRFEKRAR